MRENEARASVLLCVYVFCVYEMNELANGMVEEKYRMENGSFWGESIVDEVNESVFVKVFWLRVKYTFKRSTHTHTQFQMNVLESNECKVRAFNPY